MTHAQRAIARNASYFLFSKQTRVLVQTVNSSSSCNFCNVSKMQLTKIEAGQSLKTVIEKTNHHVCLASSPGPLRGGQSVWYTLCACVFSQ